VVLAVNRRKLTLPEAEALRVYELPQRMADARRLEKPGSHLVKQRCEVVEIVLVHQRHVECVSGKVPYKIQSCESTADDDNGGLPLFNTPHNCPNFRETVPRALCARNNR
jgi:hypothetical protein